MLPFCNTKLFHSRYSHQSLNNNYKLFKDYQGMYYKVKLSIQSCKFKDVIKWPRIAPLSLTLSVSWRDRTVIKIWVCRRGHHIELWLLWGGGVRWRHNHLKLPQSVCIVEINCVVFLFHQLLVMSGFYDYQGLKEGVQSIPPCPFFIFEYILCRWNFTRRISHLGRLRDGRA